MWESRQAAHSEVLGIGEDEGGRGEHCGRGHAELGQRQPTCDEDHGDQDRVGEVAREHDETDASDVREPSGDVGGIDQLHGPDGVDYHNKMVFLEVVKPERLVYRHQPEHGYEPVDFEVTVTFAKRGNKTELTMRMVFPSAEQRDYVVKKHGAIEGANQTLDRLAGHLPGM